MEIHFQPIRKLFDGGILGFEALARFPGRYGPAVWVQEAHRSGYIADLDRLLFVSAVRTFQEAELPGRLFVNVEAVDINRVPGWLQESQLMGERPRLVVEMTERKPAPPEGWSAAGEDLRHQRFMLALDDFRFTISFARHAVRLRPTFVKLDRSLLHELEGKQRLPTLLSRLRGSRAEVIAEGVEDTSQARKLKELGIVYGQGYGLGRPAPWTAWRLVDGGG